MTKYEHKLQKKLEKHQKKAERKQKRKDKRARRRFEKKSNAKYRLWQRVLVKTLRIGGPIAGFTYAGYQLYNGLFLKLHDLPTQVDKMNLRNASMLLVAGTVLFGFALYYGFKWIKTGIAANAVARNQGIPSMHYSPIVITAVRFILGSWLFGLMLLFNYIGINYGEQLTIAFEQAFVSYSLGFGLLLTGDITEQSILKNIKNKKHKAETATEMAIYDLTH